ncbi:cyanovirin [Flavobacterium sp. ZT3R18]|uniref:cyanovirin n=1 Tax=Flavobacterium sp. ZT3R18 TaxID=2594429 RepID=UPI00117AC8B6|nr:cyanovirin [Flavobacterium sp. ZT3R18]TRX36101.1 cyanovirin [Flavobacterium sp. ZT3R18]
MINSQTMVLTHFVPTGSYVATSKKIRVNMYAHSQKRDQNWIASGLNLTDLSESNVTNYDGILVNDSGSAPQNGYIPGGSYAKTTKDVSIVFSAYCQKRDGSWQYSSLVITNLALTKTISNIDGVLTVD